MIGDLAALLPELMPGAVYGLQREIVDVDYEDVSTTVNANNKQYDRSEEHTSELEETQS